METHRDSLVCLCEVARLQDKALVCDLESGPKGAWAPRGGDQRVIRDGTAAALEIPRSPPLSISARLVSHLLLAERASAAGEHSRGQQVRQPLRRRVHPALSAQAGLAAGHPGATTSFELAKQIPSPVNMVAGGLEFAL